MQRLRGRECVRLNGCILCEPDVNASRLQDINFRIIFEKIKKKKKLTHKYTCKKHISIILLINALRETSRRVHWHTTRMSRMWTRMSTRYRTSHSFHSNKNQYKFLHVF